MSDRLDREIRSMVVELVESSPAPHPAQAALQSVSRVPGPVTWRSGLVRASAVAVAVLLVGLAGAWIGRNVFPSQPAADVPIVEGTPSPVPSFDPSAYGEEVRLLPPTGDVRPDVLPGTLDGEAVAAGIIEGTDLELFSWYTTDPPNGACLQVVGFRARHSTCSGTVGGDARVAGPLVFPRLDEATGDVIDVVAAWQVPDGTAIVVADTSDTTIWQRPRGGVVAFVFDSETESVIFNALDVNEETVRSQGISPSQAVEPIVDQEVPSVEGVPEWCPTTVPGEDAFTPASETPSETPEALPSLYESVWYGTPELWTTLQPNEQVRSRSWLSGEKTFWWSENFPGGGVEGSPNITVTAEHLEGSAPTVKAGDPGTNGSHPDLGNFMLVGVKLPAAGCWKLTAEYKGATLSYVMWVTEE